MNRAQMLMNASRQVQMFLIKLPLSCIIWNFGILKISITNVINTHTHTHTNFSGNSGFAWIIGQRKRKTVTLVFSCLECHFDKDIRDLNMGCLPKPKCCPWSPHEQYFTAGKYAIWQYLYVQGSTKLVFNPNLWSELVQHAVSLKRKCQS